MFRFAKKNFTTMIRGGVVERKGRYIICPECKSKRSFLLTEGEPGKKISWRCPECKHDWGGIIQEDGSVRETTVERERKWILVEIDADCVPDLVAAWRSETDEEAVRRTLETDAPRTFTIPQSFSLTECDPEPEINPLGFPQYKGVAT